MSPAPPHIHPICIYYEDTDLSGVVYHANYLKFFERAREHLLGIEPLVRLYCEDGIGFVVYKLDMAFREPARHGDRLQVQTRAHLASPYRAVFEQALWRPDGERAMVEATIQLACLGREGRPVRVPEAVVALLATR